MFLSVYVTIPLLFLYGMAQAFSAQPASFFVTGFIINTAFMCAYYPTSYEGFGRVFVSNQYASFLAASLSLKRILAEDVLWFAMRGFLASLVVGLVSVPIVFPVGEWWRFIMILPFSFLTAVSASLIGLVVVGFSRDYDQLTYAETVTSLIFLFSGVFVEVSTLPQAIQYVAWGSPLYHALLLTRAVMTPEADITIGTWAVHALVLVTMSAICARFCYHLLKKRLVD